VFQEVTVTITAIAINIILTSIELAGGNDAVFCVVLGEDVIPKVDQICSTWTRAKITPLLCSEAFDGIRHEKWSDIMKEE
jgi:phosphomevalonate kinase